MKVIALQDFVHGNRSFRKGQESEIHEMTGLDLERAGLVRVADQPVPSNKMRPDTLGKERGDAGRAPLSSSLPAAPASPSKTAKPSKPGVKPAPRDGG